jgi:4-carboxymuconolactone decarboxylase
VADELSAAQKAIGDFAPKLVELSDDVLFGDIWESPGLFKRDHSLITVTALVALYRTDQLGFHPRKALENELSKDELVEAVTHMAFSIGWSNAMTAITLLKDIVTSEEADRWRLTDGGVGG